MPKESPSSNGPASLKVLVVEDNIDGAETLAAILRAMGHDTRIAFNGYAGLVIADEFRPDVVLLDIGLPGLDGYDVARTLRERRKDGLVIIAVSGYGHQSARERARETGIDHFLVKPVDLKSLTKFLAAIQQK